MGPARTFARGVLGDALWGVLAIVAAACANHDGVALSKPGAAESQEIPKVPVPSASGPKLASIADLTAVLERPSRNAKQIGYMHAGDRVSRASEPYTKEGCENGWFPVRPAGFVCASGSAT